jgi:hypothetical protein
LSPLRDEYQRETNRDLGTQVFVSAEKLTYTKDNLPLVGYAGEGRRILCISEKIQGIYSHDLAKGWCLINSLRFTMVGCLLVNRFENILLRRSARVDLWPPW